MATYDPNQLGIKAPAGGFQQGGWYSGRQYWGGTLSDPGTIHPSSNQQGAGQAVSQEVVAQTNPNNVAYLNAERQNANLAPLNNTPTPRADLSSAQYSQSGTSGIGQLGSVAQPTINLPELYKSLTKDSGIQQKQEQLSQMERDYIEAQGGVNDNPFLNEASRVGRIAKLDELYQKRTANIRGEIAQKQADIETQLNLQTKQFDINSQQAQLALQQFNTLLEQGALNNVSGEDIAAITRTTGLSSNMIQSAIQANKAKNVQTSTIQYDDGTNQGFAIINTQTGEIISKQAISASKPKATGSGESGGLTPTQTRTATTAARTAIQEVDTNEDRRLSLEEYKQVVEAVMVSTGLSITEADNFATKAFQDLGYVKWGKGWSK